MKTRLCSLAVLLSFAALSLSLAAQNKSWNFDADKPGAAPAGFSFARTGRGAEGKWEVRADASAPSKGNVLAQTSDDATDYRFPVAVAAGTSYKDLAISVKFKAISGKVDQAGGLVFRYKDADNYYVVRANALENNYRLYHVIVGRRVQFASANLPFSVNAWHTLRVEARGNEFKCFFDGQLKITATDDSFKDAGTIGLWTKADSVTLFDDLTVEDLGAAKRSSAPTRKIFAQELVDSFAAGNPDVVRIGLHVTPPQFADNIIVASNVSSKVGKKSDPEDLEAMKTGKPVVLKEGGNLDVTLPLHDASGELIGAIGLTFKPMNNEGEQGAVARAQKMTRALEKQIPSVDRLFDPRG